jgi:hypothetical protein
MSNRKSTKTPTKKPQPTRRRKPVVPPEPVQQSSHKTDLRPLFQSPTPQQTLDQINSTASAITSILDDIALLEGARKMVQDVIDEKTASRSQINEALEQRYSTLRVYEEKLVLDKKYHSVVLTGPAFPF